MKGLNKLNLHYKKYMIIDLFFSDIIETDDKIYTYDIKEVFKKDGQIVNNQRTEVYQLINYSDLEKDILKQILSIGVIKIKYPKNILQRIFKKNELQNIKFSDSDIVFSNSDVLSKIHHDNKIEFNTDYIIILSGKDKLLINKKDKLFYFDSNRFKVYEII